MKLRESFALPYAGGELWYSCLDSLKTDHGFIEERILQEEKLMGLPSRSSLILYHLYDTEITYELAGVLVDSLSRSQKKIQKLAVIGLSTEGKSNIKQYLRLSGLQLDISIKYFDDFEKAKEWLVKGKS